MTETPESERGPWYWGVLAEVVVWLLLPFAWLFGKMFEENRPPQGI
jgi:hypothetical protein